MSILGYITTVEEFESGWGSRRDGYLIYIDKTAGEQFATQNNGHICGDYNCFSTVVETKQCVLKEDKLEFLRTKGCVWVDDASPYVDHIYVPI